MRWILPGLRCVQKVSINLLNQFVGQVDNMLIMSPSLCGDVSGVLVMT